MDNDLFVKPPIPHLVETNNSIFQKINNREISLKLICPNFLIKDYNLCVISNTIYPEDYIIVGCSREPKNITIDLVDKSILTNWNYINDTYLRLIDFGFDNFDLFVSYCFDLNFIYKSNALTGEFLVIDGIILK